MKKATSAEVKKIGGGKPYRCKMICLSSWIGHEMRSARNRRVNPFSLLMSYESWRIIKMALKRASR